MAVKVMHQIWEYASDVQGSDLVVLLALADWANDDGMCWPSLPRLAAKARISVRTAQYIVHRLAARGYVAVQRGGGRHHPNCYTVRPPPPAPEPPAIPGESACGPSVSGKGVSANRERESTNPNAAPTPAEALWQSIARALDCWQPGRAPPLLPPEATAVVTALGGFSILSAHRPSWPAFLAACNRVRHAASRGNER